MSDSDRLFAAARDVRAQAYAPYSNFLVGAAIQTADGSIHVGCNVENVAYPEGTCAEAGAIAAMIAAGGSREITAILVIADSPTPITPCGGCRQKIVEFAGGDVPVYLAGLDGVTTSMQVSDLLPGVFSNAHLSQNN